MPYGLLIEMTHHESLPAVASLIAGFATAILVFRIQRETAMHAKGESVWMPWADWLLVFAASGSLVLVLLPILLIGNSVDAIALATASAAAAIILVAGYPFAILSHYRIGIGKNREGPRRNPEPAERAWVVGTWLVALGVALARGWLFITRGI